MKSLIIGASAGLGRALAEQLAQRGHELFLVASDEQDLSVICRDLLVRFDAKAHFCAFDLRSANGAEVYKHVHGTIGPIQNLFLVAGVAHLDDSDTQEQIRENVAVNFLAPVLLADAFIQELSSSPTPANLVAIGSIAAIRPRRNMAVYGACKRGLEFFIQAMRHRVSHTNCRVQFYRAGYLDTQMSFGQHAVLPAMSSVRAAERIISGLDRDKNLEYIPRWWRVPAFVLEHLPWFIFRRLTI